MLTATANIAAAKFINRVLGDYPLARERLAANANARINIAIGVLSVTIRITRDGDVEPVGEGAGDGAAGEAQEAQEAQVSFQIPVTLLPRLIKKDESAYREIAFTGDSELAHTLSTIARSVEWDIGEDLSQAFGGGTTGDIISERLVSGVKSFNAFRDEAGQRFTENVAEYLVHEQNAFVTTDELEALTRDNEMLRDDVARLEAKVARLAKLAA